MEKTKLVVITLRLPADEAEAIQAAAKRDRRSVNMWCRLRLVEGTEATQQVI